MRFLKRFFTVAVAALICISINATAANMTAHQTVESTSSRVMTLINEANGYFEQDPDRFYGEVEQILEEVVDFNSFSRGVMGPYATKDYYRQLGSKEAKKAFVTQVKRFSVVFREGLVKTYAKGLLAFGGTKVEVVAPKVGAAVSTSVAVLQKIYGGADKPYEVLYKMRQDRSGGWKVRNVTIEAVNLGKVYQGQFISAAKQYDGDIEKVIDNWSVSPSGQQVPQPKAAQ
ncbi:MAG: phospholipid transport system substrate-binding protein [Pseudohongiellaceae bacterium]|jgi:phospholipid transport system substrate-binding protein